MFTTLDACNDSPRGRLLESGSLPVVLEGEPHRVPIELQAFEPAAVEAALAAFDFTHALRQLDFEPLELDRLLWSPVVRLVATARAPRGPLH